MKIRSIEVSGYKNLTRPIRLAGLGELVVIHGPNNVGKSNLLEAMALPFLLLGLGGEHRSLPFGSNLPLDRDELAQAGYPASDIFNLAHPQPIRVAIELELTDRDLAGEGIRQVLDVRSVSIVLEISPGPPDITWRLTSFRFADGADAVSDQADDIRTRARRFGLFLSRRYLVGGGAGQRRFQVVEASRALASRLGVPAELSLRLYDAQESPDQRHYDQWLLFCRMLSHFEAELGSRQFRAIYARDINQADLVIQHDGYRAPVRLLGTGIQQLIVLIGSIVTTGAQVVAIEEPEANLSYTMQVRLRELFRLLASDPLGPSQIFLTSHSPGFQVEPCFYALTASDGGPTIREGRLGNPPTVDGLSGALEGPSGASAPLSWVTPEGLVMLPAWVRQKLGVESGGGVSFLSEPIGVRMVTDAQALAELGLGEEE